MKKRHLILAIIIIATTVLNTIFYDVYSKTKQLKESRILINKTEVSPQQLFNKTALVLNHQFIDKTMNHQDWNYWIEHYKGKIKTQEDANVAIETMVASLNEPYTRFLRQRELNQLGDSISSKICGIGVSIYSNQGNIVIISTFSGSPAEEAKLKENDIILKVDNFDCKDKSIDDVANKIRGNINTKVTLLIKRGEDVFSTTITRKEIKINTIETSVENNIGYIKMNSFLSANMIAEINKALEDTKDAKGLIIDLRNNTGGLLTNAIILADKFIEEGCIVKVVSRNEGEKSINANTNTEKVKKPVVILINETSASASEIFAGAMKDYRLATLVGQNTYGKGLVQNIIPLPNQTGINITIAKYLTPNNNDINQKGIAPHVIANPSKILSAKEDLQLIAAKRELNKLIK